MKPQAYVLRPHEILQRPITVDLQKSITIEVPDAWKHEIDELTIKVLLLVNDPKQQYPNGWCTYTYEHTQAPALESICSGVNTKSPKAFGVWRQGHLLHFGFEQSPAELNKNGRALLTNSICYISRFTEDRPIVRTPSRFYSKLRLFERTAIERLTRNTNRDLELYLDWFFGKEEREAVRGMSRRELAEWYKRTGGYLRADERGKFVIDKEARQFGIPPNSRKFIPSAIDAWTKSNDSDGLACKLLNRYVPAGPRLANSPKAWKTWWNENQRYLFFTDSGGFRWHIDPLAKKRGVPTHELRGPARATRQPVSVLTKLPP